jgi:hypothetical protein
VIGDQRRGGVEALDARADRQHRRADRHVDVREAEALGRPPVFAGLEVGVGLLERDLLLLRRQVALGDREGHVEGHVGVAGLGTLGRLHRVGPELGVRRVGGDLLEQIVGLLHEALRGGAVAVEDREAGGVHGPQRVEHRGRSLHQRRVRLAAREGGGVGPLAVAGQDVVMARAERVGGRRGGGGRRLGRERGEGRRGQGEGGERVRNGAHFRAPRARDTMSRCMVRIPTFGMNSSWRADEDIHRISIFTLKPINQKTTILRLVVEV